MRIRILMTVISPEWFKAYSHICRNETVQSDIQKVHWRLKLFQHSQSLCNNAITLHEYSILQPRQPEIHKASALSSTVSMALLQMLAAAPGVAGMARSTGRICSDIPGASIGGFRRYGAGRFFGVSHARSRNPGSDLAAPSSQTGKRLRRGTGHRSNPAQSHCLQGFPPRVESPS